MARQIWLGKCGEMVFADKTKRGDICKFNTEKMGQCLGGGLLSLSLSLSRCSRFLAHLWAKFKGLFYSFCRSFFSFYCKFFLFCRGFNSYFHSQKAFFRALCFFEIFKCFVFGFFVLVIARRLSKNGGFCHFERSEKSKEFKIRFVFGYFACAQYDKIYDAKSVWYDKFGLLLKNNGYFHSNFRDKIYKFYSFLWIATLALLARNDGKAQIQIFHSKFKAFYKFNSFHKFHSKFKAFCKFNSFYKFISNFKPYTRLFYIFTPNFRAVFTDKFSRKEELWQQKDRKIDLQKLVTIPQGQV